jgi:PST family polysaccharide transporter
MSRILFLQFLLIPLYIINEILEEKKLHYRHIVQSEILSFVLSIGIGIGMVIKGYGVWSLIVQMLLRFIFKIILLVYWTEWRPKMVFSFSRFKVFFKSGMKYTYQNLNVYLNSNMDFLLVGKFAGAWMLGIYTLAFRISNYPVMKMYQIIGRMLFPAFHLMKHDFDVLSDNYLKLARFGGFVLIPLVISIFFGIESFIIIFLGEGWLEAGIIVKILAIYLFILSFSFADETLLMTLGRINFINILRTMVTLSLLCFGFLGIKYFGIKGMASVFSIVWFISIICMKIVLLSELKLSMIQYLLKIKYIFVTGGLYTAIMALYTFMINRFTELPYIYLIGEGVIFFVFMIVLLVKNGVVNISRRKINLDMI